MMEKFSTKIASLCLNGTFLELQKAKHDALEGRKINVEKKTQEKFTLDKNDVNLKKALQFDGIEFFKLFTIGWLGCPLH